jgi:6-phosphogluconolactonase (cycloisomerase 2 family)
MPTLRMLYVRPQTIQLNPGSLFLHRRKLMESTRDTKLSGLQATFSRRNLFKGAAGLAAAASVPEALGRHATGARPGAAWLYIGTYTGNPGPFANNGEGIYLCELNLFTGKLTVLRLVAPVVPSAEATLRTTSPSTIALDPTHTHLYAGNEYGPPGAVSAYSINRFTGDLTLLNIQPAAGAPAHVSVDHDGRYLFSAEYSGSWFEVFPILADGTLGPAVYQMQTVDNVDTSFRTKPATSAPRGSFAFSAHEGPNGHPHMMEADPSNGWVLGSDAGQDRIYVWKLTVGATPPLNASPAFVTTFPGDGPRHFAFHPNGHWVYSIQEEGSTIIFWQFDPASGRLSDEQHVSSLPPGFVGTNFTSEIVVSEDGRFVYGVNRLSDTICVFRIDEDGKLNQVSHASTLGDYPRIIAIDPSGRFMVCGNQRADNVTTFRISRRRGDGHGDDDRFGEFSKRDGSLTFTGDYPAVGSPSGMVFL